MHALGALLLLLMLTPSQVYAETHMMRASWYGEEFRGETMANGEVFNPDNPSIAAHRSLPFGTILRLKNPKNGKALSVIIMDRGPYIDGRSLDLSRKAAEKLGFLEEGVAPLEVKILYQPE